MAGYSPGTLSQLQGTIEGNWKEWVYTTSDSLSTVKGAGYISDATNRGMSVGDFVKVVNHRDAGLRDLRRVLDFERRGDARRYRHRPHLTLSFSDMGRAMASPGLQPERSIMKKSEPEATKSENKTETLPTVASPPARAARRATVARTAHRAEPCRGRCNRQSLDSDGASWDAPGRMCSPTSSGPIAPRTCGPATKSACSTTSGRISACCWSNRPAWWASAPYPNRVTVAAESYKESVPASRRPRSRRVHDFLRGAPPEVVHHAPQRSQHGARRLRQPGRG